MTASSASPKRRQTTRTKRFTGCWTCRSRRVRCDEGRPGCSQCASKNIPCGGYEARLQWMPLETIGGTNATTRVSLVTRSRRLILDKSIMAVEVSQMDAEHAGIESIAEIDCHSSTSTIISGPYGVFPCTIQPEWHASTTPRSEFSHLSPKFIHSLGSQTYHEEKPRLREEVEQGGDDASEHEDCSHHNFPSHEIHPVCQADQQNRQEQNDAGNDWQETHPISATRFLDLPLPSIPQVRQHLLCYYIQKVVGVFCVIENSSNPLHSIYIPKILQTAAELSVTGSTRLIRHSLLNSVLSISAFMLANEYRSQYIVTEQKKWESIAINLRQQATKMLKEAVSNQFSGVGRSKPKYKDFLATMLSMVTIDVLSGDAGSCTVHLRGCEQLIQVFCKLKKSFSSKARALNRTYFYLRIIHDSTLQVPESHPAHSPFDPSSIPPSLTSINTDNGGSPISHALHVAPEVNVCSRLYGDSSTFEMTYGIPESLFVLLNRTIVAIRAREQDPMPKLAPSSPFLASFYDDLEGSIFDWPKEAETQRCTRFCSDSNGKKIIEQQISAFYNALVIYFSHSVRETSYRYLKSYVICVLEDLEAIEAISNIIPGPLLWPIFITSSVVADTDLQARFSALFEKVESYGFHAARAGRNVINEVWQRWQEDRVHYHWRSLVKETGVTLMLT